MLLTPAERRALLTLVCLLILGQLASIWQERRRERPDRELAAWLTRMEAARADTAAASLDSPPPSSRITWAAEAVESAADSAGEETGPAAAVERPEAAPPGVLEGGRIRVNDASARDLETLPGIGPSLARRIVEERSARGPFRRPDDLLRVKGIGPKTLRRLIDYVDFAPPSGGAP
jgi:competence ComEA-like helix-hairpin-helix protein